MTSKDAQPPVFERPSRSSAGAGVVVHLAGIGMGANLGHRERTLLAAWHELTEASGVRGREFSSPYVSAPLDMQSENTFLNAVGLVETTLSPPALLHLLLDIEARHGRRRDPQARGYQDRPLDLDLLLVDDLCLRAPDLVLPHPRQHERLFVLEPLAEIMPEWRHPTLGRSVRELRDLVRRQGGQRLRRVRWSSAENARAEACRFPFVRLQCGHTKRQPDITTTEETP